MLSRVPGIFLYSFITGSTNCYKIARAAIRALHVKDGFNYIHNIYANARYHLLHERVGLLLILTVWNLSASYDAILIWLDLI